MPVHRSIGREPGETFDAGDRRLRPVLPPIFDGPATRGLLDERTGVLWAADAFGDLYEESFDELNSLVSPWHQWLDPERFRRHVDGVEALAPSVVASPHGPVLTGAAIPDAFRRVRRLAGRPRTVPEGQPALDRLLAGVI